MLQCGAVYVHAPILTSEDCEGAGEQFRVSTLTHPLPLKDPKNASVPAAALIYNVTFSH